MEQQYRLKKDTIYEWSTKAWTLRAGTICDYFESSDCYNFPARDGVVPYFDRLIVENMPEWFEPIDADGQSATTWQPDSIRDLQQRILENTIRRGFNRTRVNDKIICITEELGELASAYKHSSQRQAAEIDNRGAITDAVADIVIHCIGLLSMLDVDAAGLLSQIAEQNEQRNHTAAMRADAPQPPAGAGGEA